VTEAARELESNSPPNNINCCDSSAVESRSPRNHRVGYDITDTIGSRSLPNHRDGYDITDTIESWSPVDHRDVCDSALACFQSVWEKIIALR